MKLFPIMLAAAAITCSTSADAVQIVDATGAAPGSVTTIGAALAGSDPEIVVKNTGVYSEGLLITRNVILRGENPASRPVVAMLALPSQPSLGTGDGVYVGGTVGGNTNLAITVKDLILIPAAAGGPTDDAMSVTPNAGAVLNFVLENVLIAPNAGSNVPAATSVWDNPTLAGTTRIPDDGIYLMDEEFGGFAGDVNTTFSNVQVIGIGTGSAGDAIVLYPGDGGSAYLTGVGTSYASRYGTQISKKVPFTITGTQSNPGWVSRKNVNAGFIFFQGGNVAIDHLVAVDNGNLGVRSDADSVATFTMSRSLIARNGAEGFWSSFVPAVTKSWTISDCTFFLNGTATVGLVNIKLEAVINNNLTVNVRDCIVAGAGGNGFENLGGAVLAADNCALVTAGPHALASVIRPGSPGTINITDSINTDPAFAGVISDPVGSSSFDVTAGAYGTASSTSGPITGWGDFLPISAVGEWLQYQ